MRPLPLPLKPVLHFYVGATETSAGGLDLLFACRPDLPRSVVDNVLPVYRRVLQAITADGGAPVEELVRSASRNLLR